MGRMIMDQKFIVDILTWIFVKKIGLHIKAMEDDDELQDAILSVHHAYMLTLSGGNIAKIIENQDGKAMISNI